MTRTLTVALPAAALLAIAAAQLARADATPDCNTGNGTDSTECGVNATANGVGSTAVGISADAEADLTIAIGNAATATNVRGIAIGDSSSAAGLHGTAVGQFAHADGMGSSALGNGAVATKAGAVALGVHTAATGDFSTAVGRLVVASGVNSTALGAESSATFDGSTAIGYGAASTAENQVTLGGAGSTVRFGGYDTAGVLVNDANGVVSTDTTIMPAIASLQSGFASLQSLGATQTARIDALFDLADHDRTQARKGIATVAAMAQPAFPSAAGKTSYAANVGYYRSEVAFSLGLAHRLDGDFAISASVSYAGGKNTAARAGFAGEF